MSDKQHHKGFALSGGSLQDFEGVVSLYHLCRHVALEGVVLILALAPPSDFLTELNHMIIDLLKVCVITYQLFNFALHDFAANLNRAPSLKMTLNSGYHIKERFGLVDDCCSCCTCICQLAD